MATDLATALRALLAARDRAIMRVLRAARLDCAATGADFDRRYDVAILQRYLGLLAVARRQAAGGRLTLTSVSPATAVALALGA